VIADRLAVLVNAVYGDPGSFAGLPLILATYAFAFQIYFDFSGYADIAIGAARVLGIQLVENFQQPYLATSIPDFWRRWHISLSNWLRDYIFYPLSRSLARSRYGSGSWLNLILPPLVTMGISGLWHGANWTFVIWGLLHGVFMIVAVLMNRFKPFTQAMSRLPGWASTGLQVLVTFHLVLLTWIFFRANSIADAFYILSHLFVDLKGQTPVLELFGGSYQLWIALAALLTLTCIHWLGGADGNIRAFALRQPLWLRWLGYYVLVVCILMFGKLGTTEFIYLQF
jgi:D-alanyl-lipoteichoic acid acyltransferase DltB (MBOAT superfamily)